MMDVKEMEESGRRPIRHQVLPEETEENYTRTELPT